MNEQRLSAIVPIGDRVGDLATLHREYRAGLQATGLPWELIYVVDGPRIALTQQLEQLLRDGERLTIVSLTRAFGEATALMAGFEVANGDVIVTLPAYDQIVGTEIPRLVNALAAADLAIGRRTPRVGSWFERLRRDSFHKLLGRVTGMRLNDLGCSARAMRRRVLAEISLYGDQHRFLALLANRQGFRVREIDVLQSPRDRFDGVYRPREYLHRALDLFTVFFLVRFTKKPLRFFGMVGAITFGVGAALVSVLVVQRMFFGIGLSDRPALLLSSLLAVLGMQIFALGLLGELIIFTHARGLKDYQVDEVIEFPQSDEQQGESRPRAEPARGEVVG